MAVLVNSPEKKDENPLDRIAQLVGIGTQIAGLSRGARDSGATGERIVSDTTNAGDAMSRRLASIKKQYA